MSNPIRFAILNLVSRDAEHLEDLVGVGLSGRKHDGDISNLDASAVTQSIDRAGGTLALAFSLDFPQHAAGLVLIAPPAYPGLWRLGWLSALLAGPLGWLFACTLAFPFGAALIWPGSRPAFLPQIIPPGYLKHAAAMLALRLEADGLAVQLTREPGGSPGAEIIRHVLLTGAAKPLGAEVEAMLFAAARDDHVQCTILPALRSGKWVVCDRFADSTRVYQGILGQVDQKLINVLERVSVGELAPDLTVILDVPVQVGLERAKQRRGTAEADRFEGEGAEFHEKLRDAYLAIAAREPDRCVLIDASASKDDVANAVWRAVQSRLEPEATRRVDEPATAKI